MTHAALVVQQKHKLSKILGRSAAGVQCKCGEYHFMGGKVTAIRFLGDTSTESGIIWDALNPLSWDLQITPEDDGGGSAQSWFVGLTHVMSDSEIRSLFLVLN
jgi:hypothetical protein